MSLERYTLKNGLISYSYKFRHRGVWYRGYIGPKSLRQAKLDEMQARILAAEGRHPPPKRQRVTTAAPAPVPTFDAFAPRFLESFATDARPTSVRVYLNRLNVHLLPFFGPYRLTEATPVRLDLYRTTRRQEGASARTINNELCTLSSLLAKAVALALIPKNARHDVPWLRVEETPVRVLTADEVTTLLMAATPRLKPLIRFALQTGLRRAELERLTWADVDLTRREVTVVAQRSKNRRSRTIPLNVMALSALADASSNHGRVFGYHSVGTMAAEAFTRAGLSGCSMHTLRRTFASRCLEAGVNVELLRQWLGHSKIAMTQRYLTVSDSYAREAIEWLNGATRQSHSPSA